ncbi:MAG TPA: peptidoglycan DD-metalloendopeptidase family protein [Prolixibacteraceae bacterium]|nr:peptidoglycan DD-metalloendopeptidase family protein [Prolixibacteraceae bacterium]
MKNRNTKYIASLRQNYTLFAILLFFMFLHLSTAISAQSISELQQKKEKTLQEIEYTNILLAKTSKNSKATLNKLSLLNGQISLRNNLINDYNTQLTLLQKSIEQNLNVITMLTNDLEQIKVDYSKMIEQAYRKRGDYNKLIFLLSSQSFNQAYKRLLYTRQMTSYRQKQSEQIAAIRTTLRSKTDDLNKSRDDKQKILSQQMKEISVLSNEKTQQSNYHAELEKRQRELKNHLNYQQRVQDRLQREIEKLIEEEAKRAKKIARTPEFNLLSDDFEKNKGRFPWPTQNGIITDKFGEHAHPVMKNIIIRNNGIDITTKPGEKARAIFKGTVSKVFAVPGGNMALIVRHGQYITVYSNLKEVYVKQGDNVSIKQDIGLIFTDKNDDDKTTLKFQIWKESVKLNPEAWIAK